MYDITFALVSPFDRRRLATEHSSRSYTGWSYGNSVLYRPRELRPKSVHATSYSVNNLTGKAHEQSAL